MKLFTGKKNKTLSFLLINLAFLVVLIIFFEIYSSYYSMQLEGRNMADIMHLNESVGTAAISYFQNQDDKIEDISSYIEENDLTLDESLNFIADFNSSSKVNYEIITEGYSGYIVDAAAENNYLPIDYGNNNYKELQKIFDSEEEPSSICYTPEFTDAHSGYKSFAVYKKLSLASDFTCTLMAVLQVRDFGDTLTYNSSYYDNMSTVLMDKDGNYIISNPEFKSDNLFRYIYVFNDLSLDEKKSLASYITESDSGVFNYKNYMGNECIFAFSRIPETGWYSVSCVPETELRDEEMNIGVTIIVAVILLLLFGFDLLWLNSINRQLRKNMAELKVANNAKTDFLSRMSHDIRTPLNGIIGMTALSMEEKNPKTVTENLKVIDSSSKFLLGLVNDILDMSKVESGKMELHPEPYRYSEFRDYIFAVLGPLFREKNLHFTMSETDDKYQLIFDRLRINQIFFNLLSNAVKFTPEGGHIELISSWVTDDSGMAEADFQVKDDGIGMSKEFQEHMFEAFSQEERDGSYSGSGTGLGLMIVDSLVKLMGGTIRVESDIGKGTTFFLHFRTPATPVPDDETAAAGDPDNTDLSGIRILLCEDHPVNIKVATALLKKKNAAVETAENGSIAVDMFSGSAESHYDIILMDIRMPVMDGLTATKRIRALEREDAKTIPIIAMTANAYDSDIENCMEAGMNMHLSKPIEPDKLYAAILKYRK